MLKSKITREISESSMPRHKCTALCIGRLLDELFLQDVQISGKAFSILLISLRMLRIALGERRSNILASKDAPESDSQRCGSLAPCSFTSSGSVSLTGEAPAEAVTIVR